MHPRWSSDHHGAPLVPHSPGDRSSDVSTQGFTNEPLPDLEQQITAELEGASWAVVVFAQEDAAWCDWIYRNLNGFPIPVTLVDRVTSQGFARPACLSIFPDLRDPEFAPHYPRALEDSIYLIVVCSPHSVLSEKVEEQIRTFKNAGGEDRILALVVDGLPDVRLGEHLRAPQCDWLPKWLRWRLEENGFRAAGPMEPRVIDARRGYRSVKQVRDSLLSALVDTDAGELERTGAYVWSVELGPTFELPPLSQPPPALESLETPEPPPAERIPEVTTAAIPTPAVVVRPRGSKYTIVTAVLLILVALVFGTRSFLEITADEPVSTLNVSPVTGIMAGRSTRMTPVEETPRAPEAAAVVPEAAPTPALEAAPAPVAVVAQSSTPPVAESTALVVSQNTAPVITPPPAVQTPPPVPVLVSEVVQVTPPSAWATSRIRPSEADGAPKSADGAVPVATSPPPASTSLRAAATAATSGESDSVLLDEVRTLERRGDETMSERRTEDALDLYNTALNSAEEYAARKGANPNARDQLVALRRKLGMLQMQNSSTAEARATYTQARKTLLQLKSQGQWNRDRAKALDEIESRLLSLPRE